MIVDLTKNIKKWYELYNENPEGNLFLQKKDLIEVINYVTNRTFWNQNDFNNYIDNIKNEIKENEIGIIIYQKNPLNPIYKRCYLLTYDIGYKLNN
jgi:hypothetical protein